MKVLNFLLAVLLALSVAALVAVVRERKKEANARHAVPAAQLDTMRGLMDVVERASKVARDPTDTGVTAVLVAGEMLKHKSPAEAIEFWNKTLPETQNESVRRAIRAQLVELYKKTGNTDAAMEQLKTLIVAAPGGTTQTAASR